MRISTGGILNKAALAKPGTMAVTGSSSWADALIEASMRSNDDDSIGIVFRYVDTANFYRFEMNAELGYRRLVETLARGSSPSCGQTTSFSRLGSVTTL